MICTRGSTHGKAEPRTLQVRQLETSCSSCASSRRRASACDATLAGWPWVADGCAQGAKSPLGFGSVPGPKPRRRAQPCLGAQVAGAVVNAPCRGRSWIVDVTMSRASRARAGLVTTYCPGTWPSTHRVASARRPRQGHRVGRAHTVPGNASPCSQPSPWWMMVDPPSGSRSIPPVVSGLLAIPSADKWGPGRPRLAHEARL